MKPRAKVPGCAFRFVPTKEMASIPLSLLALLSAIGLAAAPSERHTSIGEYGKLTGLLNGYGWVAASQGTTVTSPNPCNDSGCFRNTQGRLCTKGKISALVCSGQGTKQYTCDWKTNWGVVLGMNPTHPTGPWGSGAPARLAVDYTSVARGGSAGHFRLNVHVAGDPYSRQYCVDNYTSGAPVAPSDLKTECWFGSGQTLASFAQVDSVGILRVPENVPVDFDFCVNDVSSK